VLQHKNYNYEKKNVTKIYIIEFYCIELIDIFLKNAYKNKIIKKI